MLHDNIYFLKTIQRVSNLLDNLIATKRFSWKWQHQLVLKNFSQANKNFTVISLGF